MKKIESDLGYSFISKELLLNALTHSSFVNESKDAKNNEKLEFFGDSILSFIISEHLFFSLKDHNEGSLSKIRAMIVCEDSLYRIGTQLNLNNYIRLGKGEKQKGKLRKSIVADAVEAIISAIYLDSDIETARKIVLRHFENVIEESTSGNVLKDYKTYLQEIVQQSKENSISYIIIDETGPDHDKTFISEVLINNVPLAKGQGKSKKESQMEAAKKALEKINNETY
jgi:ribonuclease-3